jgi:hypothetical protein
MTFQKCLNFGFGTGNKLPRLMYATLDGSRLD